MHVTNTKAGAVPKTFVVFPQPTVMKSIYLTRLTRNFNSPELVASCTLSRF